MQKTLEGWENYLRSFLSHIHLLAEIPLDYSDVGNLKGLIRDLIRAKGIQDATNVLANEFPTVFITYLSAFSAINTEAGYWEALADSLNAPRHLHNLNWHKNYLSILKKLQLNSFEYTGSMKYVTTIRIHGGIPAYSLPDYFEFLLFPSLEKFFWRDLPADEFIKNLLNGEFRFYGDHTILNFFEFSGEVGISYLLACQQMVKDVKEKGYFEPSLEMNLPSYVVDAFEDFRQRREGKKNGESAPKIICDFYEKTFTLRFPKLFISPNLVENDLFWRVVNLRNGTQQDLPIRLLRSGINVIVSGDSFKIDEPVIELLISLISKSNNDHEVTTHRTWKVPVFPASGKSPLMVWQNIQEEPTLLRWRQKIPAEALAVILPNDCSILVDGVEKCIGKFGNLPNAFSDWKLEVWNFSESNYILVERNNDFPWPPIPIKTKPPEVSFTRAEPYNRDTDPNGSPLFINQIPSLRFPINEISADLSKWKITIKAEGIAPTQFFNTFSLDEAKDSLSQNGDIHVLDLSYLFGQKPVIGTYEIQINGPFGFNQALYFRVWPNLTILNLPSSIEAISKENIEFTIASILDFECECQAGVEQVSVEKTVGLYKITASPTTERVDLYLTTRTEAGLPIRVPLYVAIPGAKWLLGGISTITQTENEWCHQEVSISIDLLLQSQQPCLHLQVYGQDVDCENSRLTLCDPTQALGEIQAINPQGNIMGGQTIYFDLSGIKNNLTQLTDISIFQIKAEIHCRYKKDVFYLPLVALKRELQISDVNLEELNRDDLRYRLTWQEPYPLKNRRFLLWSAWQPWADPIEVQIPDDSFGVCEFGGCSLPPSHYRVAFYTAFQWEEKRMEIPKDEYFDLKKADAQKKINEVIQELQKAKGNKFILHFTLACIYQSENLAENLKHEVDWCIENLDQASLLKTISFYHWLGKVDPSSQKAVALRMRKPEMLGLLFQNYEDNNPIRKEYVEILATIKIGFMDPKIPWLLLEHSNNPLLEFRSFTSLVENEEDEVIGVILNWIDQGRLDIGDAVEIMCRNPEFALKHLIMMKLDNPLAEILLKKIFDQCGDVSDYIRSGYRVTTEIGTGRLIKILDDKGNEIDHLLETANEGILLVGLHDEICGELGELVEIDLANRIIRFPNAERLYKCTKCNRFVSASQEKVINNHNKIAHEGLGPAFRPIQSNTIPLETDPEFESDKLEQENPN